MQSNGPFDKAVTPISFLVKPWGEFSTAELWNACAAANAAQDCYLFKEDYEPLPLNPDSYRLADGGLDLDKAVKDMMRKPDFRLLTSSSLVLVTTAPYSEKGCEPNNVYGADLPGFFHETDVMGDKKVSIISTYLWDNLKPRQEIPMLSSTWDCRSWEPYLLLSFAAVALDKFIRLETHKETLGCPNDYCDNVVDIDVFFEQGKWFCEKYCDPTLRKALHRGIIQTEQLNAVKRILNRSQGKPANVGYYSCFVAYGKPDHRFARKLYDDLKDRNIECWIYDEDGLPGDPTWQSINVARRYAERFLIVCSKESLTRSGMLKELEAQIDENRDKLIPIALDEIQFLRSRKAGRGIGDLMPFLHERNYADFATQTYGEAFERLLKALRWK